MNGLFIAGLQRPALWRNKTITLHGDCRLSFQPMGMLDSLGLSYVDPPKDEEAMQLRRFAEMAR